MPRIRTIKPSLWASEKLGRLSTLARLNFIGLISLADDDGRGRGATRYLIGQLHAYAERIGEQEFASSLIELETEKLVAFYTVDGARYYALPGWGEHQVINRPQASAIPEVPANHPMHGMFTERSVSNHGAITDYSQPERKGRERKGMEGNGKQPLDSQPSGRLTAAEIAGLDMPYPMRGAYHLRRVGDLEPSYCRWALDHLKEAGPELRRALAARVKQGEYEGKGGRS